MITFEIVAKIAAWIVGVSAAVGVLWKIITWLKRIENGQKCQLRSDMLRTYYRHRDSATIRQYEYENFTFQYEAYKALGGNSFIDKIHKEVETWEVVT